MASMTLYISIGAVLMSLCLIVIYFKKRNKKNETNITDDPESNQTEIKETDYVYAEADVVKNIYDEIDKDITENEYSNPVLVENYYEQADGENEYVEPVPIENFYDEADK